MWVIKRREDGKYVAKPGSSSSYTQYLQCAQAFETKEKADGSKCPENEYIINVDDILWRNQ